MESILLGSALLVICVAMQAIVTTFWLHRFLKKKDRMDALWFGFIFLNNSFLMFSVLHIVQAFIWALAYYFIPSISVNFTDFSEAFYFSIVSFTALGFGDIVLNEQWRLLSGIEAINGLTLIGWTTALMFALIQTSIRNHHGKVL